MGPWLLSHFSPEALSWTGFVVLICAMIGEVAVWLVPETANAHKNLAFAFAALAVAGYTVERVGDDAIVHALEIRASTAEDKFKAINTPRIIDDAQYATLVECFKEAPKGTVYVRPGVLDRDAQPLADRIKSALKEAGFPNPPVWPGENGDQNIVTWNTPGIFLILRSMESPHGAAIQRCLGKIGIKAPGGADPNHPEGAVSIGIGPRF